MHQQPTYCIWHQLESCGEILQEVECGTCTENIKPHDTVHARTVHARTVHARTVYCPKVTYSNLDANFRKDKVTYRITGTEADLQRRAGGIRYYWSNQQPHKYAG